MRRAYKCGPDHDFGPWELRGVTYSFGLLGFHVGWKERRCPECGKIETRSFAHSEFVLLAAIAIAIGGSGLVLVLGKACGWW